MSDGALWENEEWAVTERGLERKPRGDYVIEKTRLAEDLEFGGWPGHMAEKDGSLALFNVAWLEALRIHAGHYPRVATNDAAALCRKAIRAARHLAAQNAAFNARLARDRGAGTLPDLYAVSAADIARLR